MRFNCVYTDASCFALFRPFILGRVDEDFMKGIRLWDSMGADEVTGRLVAC